MSLPVQPFVLSVSEFMLSFQFQVLFQPMGRNMSLSTNGVPPVVGSGSLEPNPCEDQIIEGVVYPYFPLSFFKTVYMFI